MEKVKIKITGSGSKVELANSLLQIVQELLNPNIDTNGIYEDEITITEFTEL